MFYAVLPQFFDFPLSCTGIQQLIDCLQNNLKEVQSLAAEILSRMMTFRLAYNAVRRGGGIKKLVRKFYYHISKLDRF